MIHAFGCVKSPSGEQSPQFSRVTNVKFDKMGLVGGGSFSYFGLEQQRVTHCPKGTRNFNAFYQLFKAPPRFLLKHACKDPKRFAYLKNSDLSPDEANFDDHRDFSDTREASVLHVL